MPRAEPILGYPSKTAAVIALRKEGKTFPNIARLLGISASSASGLYNSGLRSSGARNRDKLPINLDVFLSGALLEKLAPNAKKRQITVRALVNKILQTVARENLIDAVLDDDEGAGL